MTYLNDSRRSSEGRDLFKGMKKKVKAVTRDKQPPVQVGEHGRYQIKSGRLAGEYIARAFPKPPTNARGMIAEARGESEAAAIAALHVVIDARESRRTEERRVDEHSGSAIPSTEEYLEAISQVALTRPQRAMLTELALADETGLPEIKMANAAAYKSRASANRSFAAAGLLIANYLSAETGLDVPSAEIEGSLILGYRGEPRNEEDPGNWILHPELSAAVRATL